MSHEESSLSDTIRDSLEDHATTLEQNLGGRALLRKESAGVPTLTDAVLDVAAALNRIAAAMEKPSSSGQASPAQAE